MNKQSDHSFPWIRRVPGELFTLDEIPLLGSTSPFPWSEFGTKLQDALNLKNVSVDHSEWQWRSKEQLFEGMGDQLIGISVTFSPLEGLVWVLLPKAEIVRLINLLLMEQPVVSVESIDPEFFKAFQNFIIVEFLNVFDKVNQNKKFSTLLSKDESLPNEPCLCSDLSLKADQSIFQARLCLSTTFRNQWMQSCRQEKDKLDLSSPIADKLDVIVHLEAGRLHLKPSEWLTINVGDFLLLDSCSLDPDEDKGRVMLTINGIPFFRGKLKQGNLKILEQPLYHEVDTTMSNPPGNDKNLSNSEENMDDDDDFEFDDEELDQESGENLSDEFEIENSNQSESENSESQEISPSQQVSASSKASKPEGASESKVALKEIPSIDEIPLQIIVEVARVQMSIKKLLELEPGNLLDLNIHPEAGIDLVVNGKRIARGELLLVGETLGVRVTELT